MNSWPNGPTFVVYAVTCLVLTTNLLVLWGYSGAVRAKTKTAINVEDSLRFGVQLAEINPPAVARVLRAHSNAQASIYPFLFLGLVFVLAGGGAMAATILFGIFTAARLLHSVIYLIGKQPWRTILFVTGLLATVALMADIVWILVHGPADGSMPSGV